MKGRSGAVPKRQQGCKARTVFDTPPAPPLELSDLVQDWGGFEHLVARLHETGDVTVEHDVTLIGRSGAPRQIDVLVRHRRGLYEHKVVVECKFRKQAISRLHIDALASTVDEVGADRGVIFSTKGFQSGAVTEAKHRGIELFKVRELANEEWGLPGRLVDLWLHVNSVSIGNIQEPKAYVFGLLPHLPSSIDISLGDPSKPGMPIAADGREEKTLEELVTKLAFDTGKKIYSPIRVQFEDGGFNGDILYVVNVNYEPKKPLKVFQPNRLLLIPRFSFQVGLRTSQSRIQIDRGANLSFFLAVEDCVRGGVTTAARTKEGVKTLLSPLREPHPQDSELAVKNGTIINVWTTGFTSFDDFASLEPGIGVTRATPQVKSDMPATFAAQA